MLGRKHIICYLLISNLSFFASLRLRNNVVMSLRGKSSFLGADDDSYLNACLRRSIDSCKQCIADGKTLIEVEFPANRKSDLSVSETLDTNRGFTREFVKPFENLGKNLWVVFPDQKESFLAKKDKDWGESCSFTVTSIPSAIQAPDELLPEMIVIVNPGFNVEEWIDVAKIRKPCPMIIINGNLDRLRNGYYPRIFYPGLYKVTQEFYSSATQALFLSPIAVGGARLGAWLVKSYPGPWEIFVKQGMAGSKDYDFVYESTDPPESKFAWQTAKSEYSSRRGGAGWF